MTEAQVKQQLTEMLVILTPGSILHLLAEVLRDSSPADEDAAESLRDAIGTLWVVGIGLDAVLSR